MGSFDKLRDIREALREGRLTCEAIVTHYLERINARPELNAFVEVYREDALERARQVDDRLRSGTAGRLAGLVIGIKDVISHKGYGLQAGSKILTGYRSPYHATVVERILEEDAIIIGRQNCDEFAMGSSNENSYFGPVANAAAPDRVPGGSSGGSAVAVQAGFCHASLGSDTGGSVRQPASFCGVVGLKPTYGRVSRWGLIAYASSFDCIGPITRSVEDAALLLEIIAGQDDADSTVSSQPVPSYASSLAWSGKARIAYLRESIESDAVQPEVREQTRALLRKLGELGHTVEPVEFTSTRHLLPTYYILTTAEASSNLSRFDGVRYGYRAAAAADLEDMYKRSRSEGFGREVKRRILLGTFVLSASYYDAYYTKAQRVRRLILEETRRVLDQYDFIVSPVAPTTAFKKGEKVQDPLQMYLADIFTVQANVTGLPALSVPNGADDQGLPIGFQLMAAAFDEARLLSFGNYISEVTKEM
ncbi:MAG: glutaminyl-tRNA synthase (glutamine-hydrolyzing) subunit A [Cytophagaceae bacterium SCN 52-12]|nr:MAG: glutaminyl-tRNA synthase (glutamine-hydrolyzing) subunit A [Cytophagaceae bacterium SCN 52-12]